MSQNQAFDASIPVLTEVFQDKAETPEPEAEPAPTPASAPASRAEVMAGLDTAAIDGWSEADWNVLESRLSERILHSLQSRVDFVLEQRLRDSMEEALQQALAGLTGEIRHGLQQTIEKIVVRAVAQELAHLKALKK
jgi:hypothetical protein